MEASYALKAPCSTVFWDATYPVSHLGLSREAFTTFDAALGKTAWARGHQRRYALIRGVDILASAQRSISPECSVSSRCASAGLVHCGVIQHMAMSSTLAYSLSA